MRTKAADLTSRAVASFFGKPGRYSLEYIGQNPEKIG